ncbi:unnamed protein product [Merluccius merluccius]
MVVATATAAAVVSLWLLVQSLAAAGQHSTCWEPSGPGTWNHSCPGPAPYVMFGHGEAIHRMDLDGGNHRRVLGLGLGGSRGAGLGGSRGAVLLDYHYTQHSLFWADRHTGLIYRAGVTGAPRQKLVSSEWGVSGLAVDWLEDRLYWTNEERGDISSISIMGENQETVLSGLDRPCCLVLDPSQSLQRADLAGRIPTPLLPGRGRLAALTLDPADQRLFWAQFSSDVEGTIGSCDYNGQNVSVLDRPLRSSSVCLAVFLDAVFFTAAASRSIKRINKYSGGEATDVSAEPMDSAPAGLRVEEPHNGPQVRVHSLKVLQTGSCEDGECENVCSTSSLTGVCQCSEGFTLSNHGNYCEDVNECALWNHGCSLGCENLPGSYICSCPEGYTLLPDQRSCHDSANLTHGKNKKQKDEGPASAEEQEDQEVTFTEKMVGDQEDCGSLGCHLHARCALEWGRRACRCLHGYHGDGRLCVDIDECSAETPPCDPSAECQNTPGGYLCRCQTGYRGDGTTCEDARTTVSTVTSSPTSTPPRRHGDLLQGCPLSHASYCLYQGTCRYLPEMEAYACNCVAGYMGERCQFSDLQWWELQEAQQEKRRTAAVAACMLLLISLLCAAATAVYCYR